MECHHLLAALAGVLVELGQRQFGAAAAGIACGVPYSQQLQQLLQTWQAPEMCRYCLLLLLLVVAVWSAMQLVLKAANVRVVAVPGKAAFLQLVVLFACTACSKSVSAGLAMVTTAAMPAIERHMWSHHFTT
jgi:hypothetical protein